MNEIINPKAAENSPPKPGTPKWALRAAEDFLDQIQLINEVLDLSARGIGVVTAMPIAINAIAMAKGTMGSEDFENEKNRAGKLAELARREISSDFSILHAQASVSIWAGLECLVHDIVRDWVCNMPEMLSREPWANLKVRVGEYEPLDAEQRAAYLEELADQSVNGPLKQGLATVGLNGIVPDAVRKPLFELQQVRNVLVHRRGVADRRLCLACPWMNLQVGQRLLISHSAYTGYLDAVYNYTTELILRTGEYFGVPNMRKDSTPQLEAVEARGG
jgi:hypothetical protein